MTLSSADWANVYCDNMEQPPRRQVDKNGPWHLAGREGRHVRDRAAALAEARPTRPSPARVPAFKAVDGALPAGKALPIAKARLKIADLDETKPVSPADKGSHVYGKAARRANACRCRRGFTTSNT